MRRVLLLCTVAVGWSCIRPNPSYHLPNRDASPVGDVAGRPDATPDTVADALASIVEPPGPDALSVPPDPTRDAALPTDPPQAGPGDTGLQLEPGADAAGDVRPPPELTLSKPVYDSGQDIVVSFFDGPGHAADWIGVYVETALPPSDASRSLLWYYTDNTGWGPAPPGTGPTNGTVTFGVGSMGSRPWPLPMGRYKAIFLSSPYLQLAAPAYFQVR